MQKNERYGIGTVHINKYNKKYEVIGKCEDKKYRTIRFIDKDKHITEVNMSTIKSKRIKNPYRKSVFGVGYYGEGVDFNGTK